MKYSFIYVCFTERCDKYQDGPFEVLIHNGTTRVRFPIKITDDDIYEGDELLFTLMIDNLLPSRVNLGRINSAEVYIKDDEKCK